MDDETDTVVSPTQTVIKSSEEVENENDSNDGNTNPEGQQLSKRMLRKIRKREQWLAKLPEKRAKEREKMKLKRKAARENNESLTSRKQLKQSTMANSSCHVRVAVDLDFDDLMNPRDLGKCVKQLMRCYTLNRRASNPMQLYFTSFNGKSEQEMSKNNGYSNWDVHFKEEPYSQVFKADDIVYLTSESDNIVTTLDETKVYVIGGLVDHNGHKGLCHRLAEEKKIAHAQLPISEFLELKSRKVLTIDHVFEILLGVSEGLSWKNSFLKVLPQRKGAIGKVENDDHNSTSESSGTSETECKSSILQEPLKTCTSESNGTLETEGSITLKEETVEVSNDDAVKNVSVDGSQST